MAEVEVNFTEDDGDLVFSDDVMDADRIRRFLVAAGDVDYHPLPLEGEGPYPDFGEGDGEEGPKLTLLHWAAWYKQPATIKVLLQFGAEMQPRDWKGKTPLDLARAQGASEEVVKLLSPVVNPRASLRAY